MGLDVFPQVSDSLFKLASEYEDLLILEEDLDISFGGQKVANIIVNVKNVSRIVVQNKEGIRYFQDYVLPKNFDELYIDHAPTIRGVDRAYEFITIKYFKAFVMQHGEMKPLEIKTQVKSKRVIDKKGFFGNLDLYHYNIQDISRGDTVIINYHYQFAFRENWLKLLSNRFFFHGIYPKKSVKFNWCYNINLVVDSLFVNLDPPEIDVNGNQICYHWEFKNLPAVLNEVNSRPYRELPYFVFVPKPYDFEYTHFNSFKMEFIPIYFFLANKRQSEIQLGIWDNVIGNKNKSNLDFQKVADKIIARAKNDTVGLERMRYFQQFMVDSVRYDDAAFYYLHDEDYIKQKAGVDLWANSVLDNKLESVYGSMIPRLAKDLFTAYPVDKRTGEISPVYCPTILDNDLIFKVLFVDGTAGYVIPKSDKNHYYFEELPFYYEDIPVMLMHVYDYANPRWGTEYRYSFGSGKRNFNTKYRESKTPSSSFKENYRKVQSMVSINLKDNQADFMTRIILSGQYSTLTRCVYCDKPVDSTINPKYLEAVWDIADNVELKALKPGQSLIYYPYRTTINAQYVVPDIVQKKDGQFEINTGNWLKMVFVETDSNKIRFLDYYSDFLGADHYSYMIEFDQPILLLNSVEKQELKNEYAHIYYSVTQTAENKILLTCSYDILAKRVGKENFSLVKKINELILSIEKEKIVFRIAE